MTKKDQALENLRGNLSAIDILIRELEYHDRKEQLDIEKLDAIESDITTFFQNVKRNFSELRKILDKS